MFEPKSKFDEDEIPKNFDFTSPVFLIQRNFSENQVKVFLYLVASFTSTKFICFALQLQTETL